MASILAGLCAALISLKLNNKLLNTLKNDSYMTYFAPVVEELLKTVNAIFFGGLIFYTHFVFGIVEAAYDYCTSKKTVGIMAGLFSIVSHSIFGYATLLVIKVFGEVYKGITAAAVLHVLWNVCVVKFLDK